MRKLLLIAALLISNSAIANGIGSRFAYLSEDDPYYPHGDFPKFTVPSWIGESEVEAVVVLSIDDMCRPFPQGRPQGLPVYARQPRVYFGFLKPIADRLKQIDGRAPISVFSLQLDPEDKIVQQMLAMGMSMECHTFTHPVPLMRAAKEPNDSLALVRTDYNKSVRSLVSVKGSLPVAHRTPGCDARNTASPRFFAEVFSENALPMDSSIFTAYLKPDPNLPREWYYKADGTHRFASRINGIPFTKKFVNFVEDYPYPYVINNRLWELPAIIPGDAHGVHAYGRLSDRTVEDWKRALDITVAKQGVMTVCFHPHGYIDSKQMVAFVDYAAKTYGPKIKFLNCREVLVRIQENSQAKAHPTQRLLDVNGDRHMDVVIANGRRAITRIWKPAERHYLEVPFPISKMDDNTHFFTIGSDGMAGVGQMLGEDLRIWSFHDGSWHPATSVKQFGRPTSLHFRDINGDGISDILADRRVYLAATGGRWIKPPFQLPRSLSSSMRFVDIDDDQDDDLIFSNESEYVVWLYENSTTGWSNKLISGVGGQNALVPPITLHGKNGGAWFRKDEMAVVNEFTANPKTDHVLIRKYQDWLKADN